MKYVIVETYKSYVLSVHPVSFKDMEAVRNRLTDEALALRVHVPENISEEDHLKLWQQWQHDIPHYQIVELGEELK